MDPTGKNEPIEKDTLTLVLEEFTQEQKVANQTINELVTALNVLGTKFNEFQKELDRPKSVSVSTDIQPIQEIVRKGIIDMKLTVGTQPKPVIRKFQLLLFPEQDAKLFYKVVFSRWFLWLVIMLAITNFYKWGIHYSDNQKEVRVEQLRNERIRKAWRHMYYKNGADIKKLMESSYIIHSDDQ